jgi:hypothetical protein
VRPATTLTLAERARENNNKKKGIFPVVRLPIRRAEGYGMKRGLWICIRARPLSSMKP